MHRALTLSRPNSGIKILIYCRARQWILLRRIYWQKIKNYIPPGNYNISEWVKVVNSGFHLGQHFFLNDMQNQQEANDAQIALSLSAGEQEGTVSVDQEFAEQLDKEMNCYSTEAFYSVEKGHPTEKKYYKTSRFETTGVEPRHEARGVEQ